MSIPVKSGGAIWSPPLTYCAFLVPCKNNVEIGFGNLYELSWVARLKQVAKAQYLHTICETSCAKKQAEILSLDFDRCWASNMKLWSRYALRTWSPALGLWWYIDIGNSLWKVLRLGLQNESIWRREVQREANLPPCLNCCWRNQETDRGNLTIARLVLFFWQALDWTEGLSWRKIQGIERNVERQLRTLTWGWHVDNWKVRRDGMLSHQPQQYRL